MAFVLPAVYPILDSASIPVEGRVAYLDSLARSLAESGVRLMEYRNKSGSDTQVLADARQLRVAMPGCVLILDDRVDVAMAAGFNGVAVDIPVVPTSAPETDGELIVSSTNPGTAFDMISGAPISSTP